MRLGVDVMGGDNAPDEILKGCLACLPLLPPTDELVIYVVLEHALASDHPQVTRHHSPGIV